MIFGLRHYQLSGLVDCIIGSVPVDNHAIDTTAHHVVNLAFDLRSIGRTVPDVHMVRASEPEHKMSVNFRRGAGIK